VSESIDVPPGVDPTRVTTARLYDYFLGGTNNFPADRLVAEKLKADVPYVLDAVLANRGFHGRAAVWIARQGIRQFIDLGSGLPTQNNTHESVHRVTPDARVVYVDIDPMVAAHSGSLLAGDGTTAVITADLREPDVVLSHPDLRRLIDFAEPVGVLATDVLHFFDDASEPWGVMRQYMAEVPGGSYLALSHAVGDVLPARPVQRQVDDVKETLAKADVPFFGRPRAEVERFFDGLELVPPGDGAEPSVSYAGLWGAEDPDAAESEGSHAFYCGVALRPEGFTA
jgi:S-adenosyl methyltransferase